MKTHATRSDSVNQAIAMGWKKVRNAAMRDFRPQTKQPERCWIVSGIWEMVDHESFTHQNLRYHPGRGRPASGFAGGGCHWDQFLSTIAALCILPRKRTFPPPRVAAVRGSGGSICQRFLTAGISNAQPARPHTHVPVAWQPPTRIVRYLSLSDDCVASFAMHDEGSLRRDQPLLRFMPRSGPNAGRRPSGCAVSQANTAAQASKLLGSSSRISNRRCP